MNSVKNSENAKKRINFFKKFFKCCLSTAHDTGSDQQNSEICCLFDVLIDLLIKTNAPWTLKHQNEYFDKFYELFYR